eukprot:COSAG02_NODE_67138_length_253_cov_1.350649_1_plen_48_part_10
MTRIHHKSDILLKIPNNDHHWFHNSNILKNPTQIHHFSSPLPKISTTR